MQNTLLQCKVVQKYYYDCHTKPLNKLEEDEPVQMQVEDTCHPAQVKIKDLPKHTTILHCHHTSRQKLLKKRKTFKESQWEIDSSRTEWCKQIMRKPPSSDITTNNSPPNNSHTAKIATSTLRRSQHIIRKPERNYDSQYDNHTNYWCISTHANIGRCNI